MVRSACINGPVTQGLEGSSVVKVLVQRVNYSIGTARRACASI
jgi:hypothetical protein